MIRIASQKAAQLVLDIVAIFVASFAAFLLRFCYGSIPAAYMPVFWYHLPLLISIRLLFLWRFHLYRIYWRYMGIRDLLKIALAVASSSAAFFAIVQLAFPMGFQGHPIRYPRGAIIIDCVLTIILISGIRILIRVAGERRRSSPETGTRRVLIVGAGGVGEGIIRDMGRLSGHGHLVVGFVDSNPAKHGALIHGAPVFGGDEKIEEVVREEKVDDVIIAIPRARGSQIRKIVALCEKLPVRLRIFPGFDSLVADEVDPNQLRDIAVEDLLRRPPVEINLEEVAGYISGQRVLITGAGGSIGSELCRQIAGLNPAKIILVGQGENSVFEIEQELRSNFGTEPEAIICDVKDRSRLEQVFDSLRPTVVFHAAAHKHVPLMEANPGEAIKNNVGGTRNLAELSTRFGVRKFVLISTDKAVNPTSVMGASKRVCEMIVQAENQTSETSFMAVRFGNVLGSRGSVVPLMKKQIARGGPVTVTHPDIVRYFMTIPEAVQLVIQAGALGKGGEIFMLDMGEPVKIMELARDLIRLSGLVPDKDIKIQVTGLRPGEKLYEELLTAQEGTSTTKHEKIFIAAATHVPRPTLYTTLDRLAEEAAKGDGQAVRQMLRDLIPSYRSNEKQIADRAAAAASLPASETAAHVQA